MNTERIPFRLIAMQCCGTMICHINHRPPMYCPECGKRVWPNVKGWVVIKDEDATLKYNDAI